MSFSFFSDNLSLFFLLLLGKRKKRDGPKPDALSRLRYGPRAVLSGWFCSWVFRFSSNCFVDRYLYNGSVN